MLKKLMTLVFSTYPLFNSHPLTKNNQLAAWWRFIKWQIYSRISSKPFVFHFTQKCSLVVRRGMTGATGNIYCGLHEFEEMGFLLHFLRPEDLFVDIGANIGSYTILASGHIGSKSVSIEPVLSTFQYLETNVKLNRLEERVTVYNLGVGSEEGFLKFTRNLDTENRVATEKDENTLDVKVTSLDALLAGQSPALLKIDVEGFEPEVIKGAEKVLQSISLKAIIIELFGSENRYGFEGQYTVQKLKDAGFTPFRYDPVSRSLNLQDSVTGPNAIFLRDLNFVRERIQTAEQVKIFNVLF